MIPGFHDLSYYEILDVAPGVERKELQQGYHRMRDLYAEESLTTYSLYSTEERKRILAFIDEAYHTLVDEADREIYDRKLQEINAKQSKKEKAKQAPLPFEDEQRITPPKPEPEQLIEEQSLEQPAVHPTTETHAAPVDDEPEPPTTEPAPHDQPAPETEPAIETPAARNHEPPLEHEPPHQPEELPTADAEPELEPPPTTQPLLVRPPRDESSQTDGIKILAGRENFGSVQPQAIQNPRAGARPSPPEPSPQDAPPPAAPQPGPSFPRRTPVQTTTPPRRPAARPEPVTITPEPNIPEQNTPEPNTPDSGAFEETVYDLPPTPAGPSPLDYLEAESSGRYLREIREAKKLDFDQVYEMTRIRRPILIAIETEDHDKMPADVFLKGMVLIYARFLDIKQPEDFVTGYMDRLSAKRDWMD